jgi:hypothetical protein
VTFGSPKVPPLPGKAEPFRPPSWDEMQANYDEEEEDGPTLMRTTSMTAKAKIGTQHQKKITLSLQGTPPLRAGEAQTSRHSTWERPGELSLRQSSR